MEHRKIASLEIIPSLLGYGCMRFPTFEDGTIDEEKAMAMVDRAFEGGVNHYDTAYFYHGGRILQVKGDERFCSVKYVHVFEGVKRAREQETQNKEL